MNIIVVFPKIENARNVRRVLVKSGYSVDAACSTGAHALEAAGSLDGGIVICAYQLADMMYSELYEYLAPRFEMLLVGSADQVSEREHTDIVGLAIPFKVYELLQTVEMMTCRLARKKKKEKAQKKPAERSPGERRIIGEAKALLMERNHLSEEEAHSYLQKHSMENGTGLVETAQMVLSILGG